MIEIHRENTVVTSVLKLLVVIGIPVVIFITCAYAMMYATGRDQFPQTKDPNSVPLHFRFRGYGAESASAYWKWLGSDGWSLLLDPPRQVNWIVR